MLMAACDVHEFPGEPAPPAAAAGLMLRFDDGDMPLLTTVEHDPQGGRSRAAGGADARFTIHVYPDDTDASGSRGPSRNPDAVAVITDRADAATVDRAISLQLPPGAYRVVAWADYVDTGSQADKYYSTDDFSRIELLSATGKGDSRYVHQGNTPCREAYRGERRLRVASDGSVSHTDGSATDAGRAIVDMHRPLARFAFVTTDLADFAARRSAADAPALAPTPDPADYRVVLRYTSYMPYVYNAHTDKPVNSLTGAYFDGRIDRIDATSATLGSDYVLVNGSSTSVQVALDVYDRADGSLIASTSPVDIPLRRGHLTLVRGRFLTTKSGTGMGIDPGFSGDINIEIK